MTGSNRTPVLLTTLLVPLLGMAVALHATPAVIAPVIVLALVLLFVAGRQIGADRKLE